MNPILIVGAGQAGATLALALRQQGCQDLITLLGAECHAPYERPPLSKELLQGTMSAEQLQVQKAALYAEQGIALSLADPVSEWRPAEQALICASGARHGYARLVFATGARARELPGLTPDGQQVFAFRTLDDALALSARITNGHRLLIVGAGLIGTELASAFCERGAQITVVDPAQRPMAHAVVPDIGEAIERQLSERGVNFLWNTTVTRLSDSNAPLELQCSQGRHLQADTVVVCAGTVPDIQLARSGGLRVERGILVDVQGATSMPGVYASGDCAEFFHPLYGCHLRLEQWQHASQHAQALAAHLCGAAYTYTALPWAWTEVLGQRLALLGQYAAGDSVHWTAEPHSAGAVAIVGRGERAVGAQGFFNSRTASKLKSALSAQASVDALMALCGAQPVRQ